MLRRNMLTADCQNSRGKGKTLGLHSTVFSESNAENTPLNNKNQDKKAEKRPQLRKSGYLRRCAPHKSKRCAFSCSRSGHAFAKPLVASAFTWPAAGLFRISSMPPATP